MSYKRLQNLKYILTKQQGKHKHLLNKVALAEKCPNLCLITIHHKKESATYRSFISMDVASKDNINSVLHEQTFKY